MRALVTGNLGFIGGYIHDKVGGCGMDKKRLGGDCCNPSNFPRGRTDVIFHAACDASIPYSLEHPQNSNTNNIGALINTLEHAKENGCPVIYSSSSSIYGDVQTPYSLQKNMGEQYCRLYWELYNVPSVCLRYFNVYGEGQPDHGAYKLALGIFLRQYKQGKPFTMVGTGEQRRDFVYIDDVVEANLQAYKQADGFYVYDVGTGTNHSINEVADMIDPDHPTTELPPRVEPFENKAELTKGFDWRPRKSLRAWLQHQS